MAQRMDRTDIQLQKEKCLLVSAIIPGRFTEDEDPLGELKSLIDTVGGEVVGEITQRLDRPHRKTYLGKGKFADMADLAIKVGADTIVVDDALSPNQIEAIEEACRLKIIDRNEVILDIFCHGARSHQASLQVALAQLQYELPRLVRKWTHLERLGGGIGTRGPGERQIETDRRIIRNRIDTLRKELDEIEGRKAREVKARTGTFTTCLVGYTNAGKSSLLNKLTNAGVYVEDKLFATLETKTRRYEYEDGLEMLISDTVGFIRRLPHSLVASFHATLEEAAQADLLMYVIDANDPLAGVHIQTVEDTLEELGMGEHERLYVFNKVDLVKDEMALSILKRAHEPSIGISAYTGEGIDELLQMLREKALSGKRTLKLKFSAGDGKRQAIINQVGIVSETVYEDSDVIITATLDLSDIERLKKLPGEMIEV